jgi:hypothetical protein
MEREDGILPLVDRAEVRAGLDRARRLSPAERDLYRWVLRAFTRHGTPPVDELVDVASSLGLDFDQALARLAEEDLVHRDQSGEIVVAYPFSGAPTAHRVRVDGGKEVYAMCAVDALGIPFMLGEPGEIRSSDPLTGAEIGVQVQPGFAVAWQPDPAVVLWAATGDGGPSAATCCRFVHFFSSAENARHYLGQKSQLTGEILTVPIAAEAGKAIFGDVLATDE